MELQSCLLHRYRKKLIDNKFRSMFGKDYQKDLREVKELNTRIIERSKNNIIELLNHIYKEIVEVEEDKIEIYIQVLNKHEIDIDILYEYLFMFLKHRFNYNKEPFNLKEFYKLRVSRLSENPWDQLIIAVRKKIREKKRKLFFQTRLNLNNTDSSVHFTCK